MMMEIDKPRLPADHPDRAIECEQAIEVAVMALELEAIHAGWTIEEVDAALMRLAAERAVKMRASVDLNAVRAHVRLRRQ